MIVAVYVFPNLKYLSITLTELLDEHAPIKEAVRVATTLWGAPRLLPHAGRISVDDLAGLHRRAA